MRVLVPIGDHAGGMRSDVASITIGAFVGQEIVKPKVFVAVNRALRTPVTSL